MEPPLPPKQEPTEPIVVPAAAGGPACATPEDEARALKREARKKRRLEKRLEQEAKWREKRKTGRRPKSKSRLRARKFERLEQDAPKHTIVIDLSFDDKMNDREVRSICQQVAYCRGVNRRVQTPASIMCSSLNGRAAHRLTKVMTGFSAWRHWSSDSRHFTELYPKEKLVYLSSEATTSLQTVDPDKVYVIGGLVDHNRHKVEIVVVVVFCFLSSSPLMISDRVLHSILQRNMAFRLRGFQSTSLLSSPQERSLL